MISAKQKEAVDFAVSLNPTWVVIDRVEYVEKDGARERQETRLKPQTMLLFPKSAGKSGIGQGATDADAKADAFEWGALVPSTGNVRWGAHIADTFEVEGLGEFEIVSGRPLMIGSDVNGYELVLDRRA